MDRQFWTVAGPDPDLSPEQARRYLIRLLGKQDLDEHEEIYEGLAHEWRSCDAIDEF